MTPDEQLFKAVKAGEVAGIQEALDAGADVNARRNRERTPLHDAASPAHAVSAADSITVVELLIVCGANVNARDAYQGTPLHRAAHLPGYVRIAELLIKHGADVNAKDEKHVTPLHNAAADDLDKVVRLLIAHGADVGAIDNDGWTPLRRAVTRGNWHLVGVLRIAPQAGTKAAVGNA